MRKGQYKRSRWSAAFTEIRSEAQAYWLGFLLADGTVGNHRTFSIALGPKDIEHVRQLRAFLKSDTPIYTCRDGCAGFSILDHQMASDLERLGVRPNHDRTIPDIDPDLKRHCYRGLVDGDGWIRRYRVHGTDLFHWEVGVCGGKRMCSTFLADARRVSDTKTSIRPIGKIWHWTINGRLGPLKVASWLYAGSEIYLARKYKLFLAMTDGLGRYDDPTLGCVRAMEVARMSGASFGSVHLAIKSGQMPCIRAGRWRYIPIEAATAWSEAFRNRRARHGSRASA